MYNPELDFMDTCVVSAKFFFTLLRSNGRRDPQSCLPPIIIDRIRSERELF